MSGRLFDDLLVTDQVREGKVKLPNGKRHTLYFRDVTQAQMRDYYAGVSSKDEDEKLLARATLLAACLCEPDGTPALTVEQASKLKPAAVQPIIAKLWELNDVVPASDEEEQERTAGN